jgi:hypothetical protein
MARVSLSELNIPFLSAELKDQSGIRVRFAQGKIKLPHPITGHTDKYLRYFTVYLDADATRVIAVKSKLEKRSTDIAHLDTVEEATTDLRNASEFYESFPPVDPKVTFIDALQWMNGLALEAQEIDGIYILYSSTPIKSRPAWVINLRGLPPVSAKDDHMRYVVDAITGGWLIEADFPNPD